MNRVVKDSNALKGDQIIMVRRKVKSRRIGGVPRPTQRAERNANWIDAHGDEVFAPNRGKYICVAGCELFVADTVQAVVTLAKAAHPEDDGRLLLYVPKIKRDVIYAH